MGYCPFSTLGRDPGTVSRQAGPGMRIKALNPGAHPSVHAQHNSCERSNARNMGQAFRCRDTVWPLWCHDTEVAGRAEAGS